MFTSTRSAQELRELYFQKYNENKEMVENRINDGIEQYRKGDATLRFTDKDGKPLVGKTVRVTQKSHDFKYGANIFMIDEFPGEKENKAYRELFKKYFNLATIPFYWDALEPNRDKPRYDKDSEKIYRRPAPDLCMEYCEENGITPKLHCLVYEKFVPAWLTELSLEDAKAAYEKRFKEIADRYTGKMMEFEVINEVLLLANQSNKKSPLAAQRKLVPWAFKTARKYFPNETLVINEASRMADLAKQRYQMPYFLLIEAALANGAEIDKIGMQDHTFTGAWAHTQEDYEQAINDCVSHFNPLTYFNGLDVLADFNKPIEITEITIPTFGESEEYEELQADLMQLRMSIFFSHPLIDTAVYWNTADGYAYDESANWKENNCRGGLFRHDMTPKKAAERLYELFNKTWHTDLELVTDETGCVNFRGFYGDYTFDVDGKNVTGGIHKDTSNTFEFVL